MPPPPGKPVKYTTHLLDTAWGGEEFILIQRTKGGKLQLLLPPHNTAVMLLADAANALPEMRDIMRDTLMGMR